MSLLAHIFIFILMFISYNKKWNKNFHVVKTFERALNIIALPVHRKRNNKTFPSSTVVSFSIQPPCYRVIVLLFLCTNQNFNRLFVKILCVENKSLSNIVSHSGFAINFNSVGIFGCGTEALLLVSCDLFVKRCWNSFLLLISLQRRIISKLLNGFGQYYFTKEVSIRQKA